MRLHEDYFSCPSSKQKLPSSSSMACILMEQSRVHDAAPDDAVLIILPGHVDAKVQRRKVLFHIPQPGGYHNSF